MSWRQWADVVAAALMVALTVWQLILAAGLAELRDRARAECERRNASEQALRDYHSVRRSYYAASQLTELVEMEARLLARVPPLPDCG